MRFKVDENLPDAIRDLLKSEGWDAATVRDQGLGGASDVRLAAVCAEEDRILVTLDRGFANITAHPPANIPGCVVFRPRTQDKTHLIALARRASIALRGQPMRGELWIVEERRIRIRRG